MDSRIPLIDYFLRNKTKADPAPPPKRAAKTKTENAAPSPFDAGQAALDAVLTEHLDLSPGEVFPKIRTGV